MTLGLYRAMRANVVGGPAIQCKRPHASGARGSPAVLRFGYAVQMDERREYPQLHGDYIPNLSIVDLLMNCGERAADYLWGYRGTHGSVAAQRHQADGREP